MSLPCRLDVLALPSDLCSHRFQMKYELSIPSIRNTFLIWSCTCFCPQNSLNSTRYGLYKVFHRDSGPCWLQCFPQLSSWLDVFWVVDHSKIHTGNCLVWKTQQLCSFWHKPVHLVPTTIPRSKALKSFVLLIHCLNGTHTQSMSHGLKILL
jgi:hypothetical protein